MSVLDEKYQKLALNYNYLTDPLLMALAWKKAHDYIRTTSWYADNFELDVSSIDLASRCDEWVEDLKGNLSFKSIDLVPAPKTHSWEFVKPNDPMNISDFRLLWQPSMPNELLGKINEEQNEFSSDLLRLRPLAHIDIREQTIMTLIMMCLANEVETYQGDPSTDYEKVHEDGVVSYGNRLYCRYIDKKAEHSYGATTIYSKYFIDYRKFLDRPYYFAKKELYEKTEEEEIYLLELDLSQFFDLIDRKILIEKIGAFAKQQDPIDDYDKEIVVKILSAFKDWSWTKSAKTTFQELCRSDDVPEAPMGLPQSMVASGFLANIYMSDFDDHMKSLIGQPINKLGDIKIIDYCRYVDDMRIVMVGPGLKKDKLGSHYQELSSKPHNHLDIIKSCLLKKIEPELKRLNLKCNSKKTSIEIFRGKSVGISHTLEDIQANVSGPVSYEDAEIHLGQLESLLLLSNNNTDKQSDGSGRLNLLAAIEKDMFDVREDTLKRFAANKISRLLNNIRHFTSRETDESGHPIPGEWDYLQERLARRFIACWSRDPALVLLLKKGLELFPSTNMLEPILTQLEYLRSLPSSNWFGFPDQLITRQAAIGRYCLAEVFRHAATIIHRKDRQAIPAHADIDSFFELLQSLAIDVISETLPVTNTKLEQNNFDFLATQARFLLLVRLDTTFETSSGCPYHDFIFKLAKGFRVVNLPKDLANRNIAAGIIIARQLVDDPKPLLRASTSLLETQSEVAKIVELIAIQDATLFRALVLHSRTLQYKWVDERGVPELIQKLYIGIRPSAKPLEKIKAFTSLYKLISRPDNPFGNEIMALKLMEKLLLSTEAFSYGKPEEVIDLDKTRVQFGELSYPPSFKVFDTELKIDLKFNTTLKEAARHLLNEDNDTYILQRIALCLRAVLAGSGDPTGFGQTINPRAGYRGLKSSQYKRQIGMLTTPESLVGESAEFSGWLTTLLSKLLKWPGIRINDQGYLWPTDLSVENVTKLVKERLKKLEELYCRQSRIPSLPELVSPSWGTSKRNLIVAMVQTKMPQVCDFVTEGVFLDHPSYRVRHRRHLARVAKLVTKHIQAQHLKKPNNGEREQDIDLIVLPELAVHQDDMDILIQLSRKTHAIIVAGLGFINQPGVNGPNNCAVWIVPRKHNGNQNEIRRLQGKFHMTASEELRRIKPWRPYQLMLVLAHPAFPNAPGFNLTAAICFDSTDIALSADLRDKSHALLIPALNQDVNTFDSMVEALHYHMYQHIILVNSGEYGGSYAMAPYDERHKRLIAHSSGNDQVTINTFMMNMFDFRRDGVGKGMQSGIQIKTAPAGVVIK